MLPTHAEGFNVYTLMYINPPRHTDAHGWASECPDVKNCKWRSGTGCFI